MVCFVLQLNDIHHEDDLDQVGGKALNLALMYNAGFPVPTALSVTVDAYDFFLNETGLRERISSFLKSIDFDDEDSLREGSKVIRDMIVLQEMPEELNELLHTSFKELGEGYFAVRSSAVAEDLPGASFAGQQDTFLNVPLPQILEKTAWCWASYWNERAMKYRHDSRVAQLETGMAVVIQKMVDSVSSGIMFTRNPINGMNTIVIESSWGLGESIASGLVTPDRFVIDPEDHKILERDIGHKVTACFRVNGTNSWQDLATDKASAPSLNDAQLETLAQWAHKIENFFGTPQDVEWGYANNELFLLQSRPITALNFAELDDILWTRAYGDEYWADATSPLFYSVMGEMLTEYVNHEGARVMGYNDISDSILLRLHRSHVYFNAEVLERVFSYYPRFARSSDLLNYFPVQDQERISEAKCSLLSTVLSQVFVAIRDPDGMMNRTDKAYRSWAESFLKVTTEFDQVNLETLDDDALFNWYETIVQTSLKHYQLIRYGMVSHSIATNLAIKQWLRAWLNDKDGELYSSIISGLPGNKTIQTNIGFSNLAKMVREDPYAMQAFQEENTPLLIAQLSSDPELKSVQMEIDRFLEEFGHRSHTREIYFSRWKEDTTQIIDIVRTLSESELDLAALESSKIIERAEAEAKILGMISLLPMGALKKKLFQAVMKLAQTYLVFRENQRFYLDHILFRQRLIFLEYGRRHFDNGILDEVDDIFFMTKEEIFSHVGATSLKEGTDIHRRRMDFMRNRNVLPPKFLRRNVEFDDSVIRSEGGATISGTSASPGVCTGTVRVVGSIKALSGIKEGEILVTSNTDPGWTAIFSKLGGLITETGGILSHGAVVSREYGIPAVTAVKNATNLLKTGQTVTIDGNQGLITIHPDLALVEEQNNV